MTTFILVMFGCAGEEVAADRGFAAANARRVGAPAMSLSPPALDLSDVNVGCEARQRAAIQNEGAGALTVTGVVVEGDAALTVAPVEASLGEPPWTIPGGQEVALDVAFTPSEAGEASGWLVVAGDDPATPEAAWALTGSAHLDEVVDRFPQGDGRPTGHPLEGERALEAVGINDPLDGFLVSDDGRQYMLMEAALTISLDPSCSMWDDVANASLEVASDEPDRAFMLLEAALSASLADAGGGLGEAAWIELALSEAPVEETVEVTFGGAQIAEDQWRYDPDAVAVLTARPPREVGALYEVRYTPAAACDEVITDLSEATAPDEFEVEGDPEP